MSEWEALIESTIDAVYVNSTSKEIRIELTCAWEGKARKQIVATRVDDFTLDEMRLSNIIDRVIQFNADDFEAAKRLFFLMRGKEPNASDLEWPVLKEKLALIRDGKLRLLEIEPVYGATILILAESFKLEAMS